MAYCTLANVTDRLPQITISSTSKPVAGVVTTWTNDVSVELDASLRNLGYTVPITGTDSLIIVKQMVVREVMARILDSRQGGVGMQGETGAAEHHEYYQMMLRRLMSPSDPLELPDAGRTTAEIHKGGWPKAGFGFFPDNDELTDETQGEAARVKMSTVF
jgi:hypothetical protein